MILWLVKTAGMLGISSPLHTNPKMIFIPFDGHESNLIEDIYEINFLRYG